jgi:hypothetical protein
MCCSGELATIRSSRYAKCSWQIGGQGIHQPLEGLASITKAKLHPAKFKQADWHYNGSLLHVAGGHWYLLVPLVEI